MKPIQPLLLLAALLAMPMAYAQHDHAAHAHTGPVAPPAQPWAADAVLSANMGEIHAVLEQLRHYEMGHMDAALASDRASVIAASAAEIFAKCALTPQKDAVLHGMLVPLLAATQKFMANPRDLSQLAAMRAAVARYPLYFAAPDWPAPAAHAH